MSFVFGRVKHVYGYEVVPQAISDARRNATLNGISNATFVQGDLNKIDENFGNEFPKPDIVISGHHLYQCFLYRFQAHKKYIYHARKCFIILVKYDRLDS